MRSCIYNTLMVVWLLLLFVLAWWAFRAPIWQALAAMITWFLVWCELWSRAEVL